MRFLECGSVHAGLTDGILRHDVWRMSSECTSVQREIETIEQDGRNNSKVETKLQRDFATAWFTQFRLLYKREIKFRWRNTDYLFAKYLLNIACGLLIGVSLPSNVP